MSTFEPGRALGRYRILRVLGSGAMGDVYLAEDPQIERQLAIKTVRVADGKPEDVEDRKRRLLREAKAAGRLIHPHIVTLFDAGEADGVLYLAFEFVAGSDLAKRIDTPPPLTLGEVLRIVREAADALGAAHQQGIVHRDVKPSNILLDARGRVKVADFGIAKVVGQATELTMTGSVVGSPHYLSPEQVRGEELDGRTDIFSLGVVLYELLGHQRPFGGETLTTLVYQILHQDPAPISSLRADLAPRIEQLLRRMLAKDREQRFPDAAAVVADIATLERTLPSDALAAPASGDPGLDRTHLMPSTGGGATAASPRSPTAPTVIANAPTSVSAAQPLPRTGAAPLPPTLPGAPPRAAGGQLPDPGFVPTPVAARKSPVPLILLGLVALVAMAGGVWMLVGKKLFPTAPPSTQQASADTTPTNQPATTAPEVSKPVTPSPAPPTVPSTQKPATTPTEVVRPPVSTSPEKPPATPPSSPSSPPSNAPPVTEKPATPTPAPPTTRPSTVPVRPTPPSAPPADEGDDAADHVTKALPPGTRDWNAGLALTFNVKPPDLNVKLREISEERGTVIGEAGSFTGKKDHPAFALPGPGEYHVTLVRNGETVASYLVHARSGGPGAPLTFDANAPRPRATGDAVISAGAKTVKERVILKVEPSSATVYLDGRAVGSAKDFSGGFTGSKVLQIPPGAHKLRIEAAGFRAVEYSLQVVAAAPNDKDTLRLDLERD